MKLGAISGPGTDGVRNSAWRRRDGAGGRLLRSLKTFPTGVARTGVKLLAPVQSDQGHRRGTDYRDHAQELESPVPDTPVIFLKPSTTIIGPDDAILYPGRELPGDYEAELGDRHKGPDKGHPA